MRRKIIITTLALMFLITAVIYAEEATIIGDNLNVRSGPGTEYDVIHQVNTDETYTILEQSEEWIKIDLNDGEGWVHKDFIEVSESSTDESSIDRATQEEATNEEKTIVSENTYSKQKDSEYPYSLTGKVIVLDPGHGGRDVGAIGVSTNVESDYTLKTANVLKRMLEEHGATVVLTRDTDRYVPLTSRSSLSNMKNADVFMSIHYNSTPEHPSARGIGTYYYNERDQLLASYVQEGLIGYTGFRDRGIHQENLQVLRINHRPGLLLELGFISNLEEEREVGTHAFLDAASRGIVQGLYRYFAH